MKFPTLFLPFLLIGQMCFGQTPRQLTAKDSIKIETEIKLSVLKLNDTFTEKQNEFASELYREFTIDTFKIEERQRLQLDIDYSTTGMVKHTLVAHEEYDKLLNKYYLKLLNSLNDTDKKTLKKSQRNWVEFRDSEQELNGALTANYYSGGGSIQSIFASSRILELTKNRVIELYHYLNRGMN
ncbi:lysozyme inhibitor LprI family protein [Formosa sp. A9]|uniref:lysozyme inhibitor LprI family protein n=1 Tax=Formosa sp. A9 TaxID=3442641 RepID=UPI003EC0852F